MDRTTRAGLEEDEVAAAEAWVSLTAGWPEHWAPLWITDGITVYHGQWGYGYRGPGRERHTYWWDMDNKHTVLNITHWMPCIPPVPPRKT